VDMFRVQNQVNLARFSTLSVLVVLVPERVMKFRLENFLVFFYVKQPQIDQKNDVQKL